MSKFSRFYHLIFGLLDLIALSSAFYLSIKVLPTFFSYFTVLSNILITVLFLYFGFINPKKDPKNLSWIYGAGVLYMTITGVIYWSILVTDRSLSIDPWINLTLHGVMPIAAVGSWILFPSKNKLRYKNAFDWLIFPIVFVFYTLIRGYFVNWYPYPFLNPLSSGSYLKVGINVLELLFSFWIIGLILIWLSNKLSHK